MVQWCFKWLRSLLCGEGVSCSGARQWVRPSVAPATRTDSRGAERGLTRCATERSSAGNSGSDPLKRRKGGGTATERGRCSDRKGGFGSLLCEAGVSCSGARQWVRPSVASSGTAGSDPLSHRHTERTARGHKGSDPMCHRTKRGWQHRVRPPVAPLTHADSPPQRWQRESKNYDL